MDKWDSIAKEAERRQERYLRHLNWQARYEEQDNESQVIIEKKFAEVGR